MRNNPLLRIPLLLVATAAACGGGAQPGALRGESVGAGGARPSASGGAPASTGGVASGGDAHGAVAASSSGAPSGGVSAGAGGAALAGAPGAGGSTATNGGASASGGASSSGGSAGSGGASGGVPLAFPGARGFGKKATGGRDGTVYHVTNLDDSGKGSFRDAVSSPNRIVVFDVAGYVRLATAVSVKSNITIAGQTAPGDGIAFRGGEISLAGSSNVVLRFIRVRPGSETASTDDDALSLYRARNVMIDHCSFEFAPWNDIDGVSDDWQNHPVTDITIQDSLIADPIGQQFGAHTESVSSQWAWYGNVFANSHNRNPLAKVDTVFVDNVLYNYSAGYTTHTSTKFRHDIANNYFIFGPASKGTDNTWYQIDENQSIYAAGNLKDTDLDGTLGGMATSPSWYQGTGTVLASPWSGETNATPPLDAASSARVALSVAGTLPRDSIDALIVSQVMTLGKGTTGTGAGTVGPDGALYTSQTQTGLSDEGYGAIASGTRPPDTDGDGMPDDWERATGSNPAIDDAMTKAPDGYALIEHYLNWLGDAHVATKDGVAADVELRTYTTGFASAAARYTATASRNGTVALATDGHTAHFTPVAGFHGLAWFDFTVTGSDGTAYTATITVLVTPS